MMLKKSLVSLSVAGILLTAATTSSAKAADGTVKFEGEILDSACIVDIGAGNQMTVDLGKVNKTAFTGAGSLSSATKFTLKLKSCPETIHGTTVKFDGTAYSGDDAVLALTEESGAATGVGIQLSDKAQKVLPLFTASDNYELKPTEVNNLDFYARYVAKADNVTAGPANSVATFTMNYN